MRAALLQMTAGIDPAANAATLVDAIDHAAAGGAAMVFTPEMSGLLDRDRAAEWVELWVGLGSLALRRSDGRYANRGFVIDDARARSPAAAHRRPIPRVVVA